jgi:hypothetical protein
MDANRIARGGVMSKNLRLYPKILSNEGATVKRTGRRALALAIAILSILITDGLARAAPFDPLGHDWEGYSDFVRLFRAELGSTRAVVTNHLDWTTLRPDDALVLVYPERGIDVVSAGAFVRSGGRLALIDDFGAGDELLTSFDIHRVPLPARPRVALRDNPDLAIAEPAPSPLSLTDGIQTVITNHASGLLQPRLTTVLHVLGKDGSDVPLALSASVEKGRLLAVGDPSILMNTMLRYPGNYTFARNVIDYLAESDQRERSLGRVYLIIRNVAESGTFPGAVAPTMGHEIWVELSRTFAGLGKEGLPAWMMYWLSFVALVLVLVWLIPRTTRTYRSAPPRFTRGATPASQGGAAGRAAALGAKQAYRGHAMLEWRKALIDDLTAHFGLPRETSGAEVLRHVARLGVVKSDAIRRMERVLLRMAEIETMIAAKQTHALEPIKDEEVILTGVLVHDLVDAVHAREARRDAW